MVRKNLYTKLKAKQNKEFKNFPMIYAFSNEQLKQGMEKLGLKENETDKLLSLGAGAYIKETDLKALKDICKRHKKEFKDEIKKDTTGEKFIKDMFRYELANHEYCITYDLDDTLDTLGLTIEEINRNPALTKGLELAKKEYLEACEKAETTEDEFGD